MIAATLQLLALTALLSQSPSPAPQTNARHSAAAKPNRDAGTLLNPDDQSETEVDIKTTQQIRQQVMDDDRLSFTAKNVKIITRGGITTLRGEVKSRAERDDIRALATQVAGPGHVVDQLEISGSPPSNSN